MDETESPDLARASLLDRGETRRIGDPSEPSNELRNVEAWLAGKG